MMYRPETGKVTNKAYLIKIAGHEKELLIPAYTISLTDLDELAVVEIDRSWSGEMRSLSYSAKKIQISIVDLADIEPIKKSKAETKAEMEVHKNKLLAEIEEIDKQQEALEE